jgi:hypothetical protein
MVGCAKEKEREWTGRGKKSGPEVGCSQGKRNWAKQAVVGLHVGKEKNKEKCREEWAGWGFSPRGFGFNQSIFYFPDLIQIQI